MTRRYEPESAFVEQDGQALVLIVLALTAVLAMVALIVDGGNVWSQQRIVQNGSDGAAEAGAVVMAEMLSSATPPAGGWDALVASRIAANAAANGISISAAYYTDICGIPLTPAGDAAIDRVTGRENLSIAAMVGSGMPASSATTPDCPSLAQGPPAGVLVLGHKDVGAYFAGVVGITRFGVDTRATAVAGYLQGYCAADENEGCQLLPVTIPVNTVTCDGRNKAVVTDQPWQLGVLYKVPLCGNDPGNVGWLDWTPPNGGTSELVCSILHPNNPALDLPAWEYVTETGNVNGGGGSCGMSVESAIRTYNGQVVLIPEFDATCADTPDNSLVEVAPNYGCDALNGHGQINWYRMPSFAFFQLCAPTDGECVAADVPQGAYIGGNNSQCDTGNGATSCLAGRFVKILGSGEVGPGVGGGTGNDKTLGIQLIK